MMITVTTFEKETDKALQILDAAQARNAAEAMQERAQAAAALEEARFWKKLEREAERMKLRRIARQLMTFLVGGMSALCLVACLNGDWRSAFIGSATAVICVALSWPAVR